MELMERAQSIIAANLALKPEESLAVITDESSYEVGKLFYDAARMMGRRVTLSLMPDGKVSGEEPPAMVAAVMKAADVALCPTVKSMTHTHARIEAAASGTRVVTMPGITLDMLREGGACADYVKIEALTERVTAMLDRAKKARIEKDGHVLLLDLEGRPGVPSPGVFRSPGASGNFPSGEAYIAPIETGANGTMSIDGSMVGIGMLERPMTIRLKDGRLVSLEGEDGKGAYRDRLGILFARPENGTIAELGIGTNEQARLCGVILEDEKLYGTVHLAFGTNDSFGGITKADCHYDGVILGPTLFLDDELVIDKGRFVG